MRTVLLGTEKGAFTLRDADGRVELAGPYLAGEEVYTVAIDSSSGAPHLLASGTSMHWGTTVRISDDLGASWTDPATSNVKFPADTGAAIEHVWQLQPSANEPGVIYAGVEPAALFRSEDHGRSFELVRGLWDHPLRPQWQPGFGGLCLHSIVVHPTDPQRVLVAISSGGLYRTDDGGATWTTAATGVRDGAGPVEYPEWGQCVHRAASDASRPDTVFLQGHWGMYRSDDFGETWNEISAGLPSTFGFPLVTHPRRSGTAYVIPLISGENRWMPDARCRVFRTTDSGASWETLDKGLPQEGAYLTVLRDAFCGDGADPLGLYFGTRSGEVYGSFDEGESWQLLASHLPAVLSVRAADVE
jgi:photosystem II stability/assembly factor-like uncharacterized protein